MREFWWAYLLIGLACGVFSVVFGVGSGILLIPALVLFFHFQQKSAQGVCLAVMVPMALVGTIRYKLMGIEIDMAAVAILSVGAVGGALAGAAIAAWASGQTLRRLFACVMIVVAVLMMTKNGKEETNTGSNPRIEETRIEDSGADHWLAYLAVGVVCGVFSAVFGVGSGILLIPALVLLFDFAQKSAQGACLAVMVPMALVGAVRYKKNPKIQVDMPVVYILTAGAVAGVLSGAFITAWTPGSVLRRLFACIMIVAAVKMLRTKKTGKPSGERKEKTDASAD